MDKPFNFDYNEASASINDFSCVETPLPKVTTTTMGYIPFQFDMSAFTPDEALKNGTLFKCLNKEFYGRSVLNG